MNSVAIIPEEAKKKASNAEHTASIKATTIFVELIAFQGARMTSMQNQNPKIETLPVKWTIQH
jgi:hypothetical protein